RADGADRLRRAAGDRADGARDTAGGLPALGIPAGARRHRRHRRPPRDAGEAGRHAGHPAAPAGPGRRPAGAADRTRAGAAARRVTTADHRPPAIALMGPTASGKTALALDWAARWPLHVVSVDSALVYRGMDIGSAKPEPDVLARVPHALVDVRDPHETYSAAQFAADALAAMHAGTAAGRVPLLVGGTGLYFHALLHGLSAMPESDP